MKFQYELKRSSRKTLGIEIKTDGTMVVRAPMRCPQSAIDTFLQEKQDWILEKMEKQKKRREQAKQLTVLTNAERELYRRQARIVFEQKVKYYAGRMNVTYGRIDVRDQKTRWGSCSAEGNLNFNWRLIFAPAGVLDYVVVHELAHRKEMNHSARFWGVVESYMPEYKKYQAWLKENGNLLPK